MAAITSFFLLLCLLSPASAFSLPNNFASSSDIAIVGCGVLGTSLCKQLLSSPGFEFKTVTGITKTNNNHESILDSVGGSSSNPNFHLVTAEEIPKEKQFTHVVFCAPPSGFEDYPAAVKDTVENLWAGPDKGMFVFTSSGGIYGPGNGDVISETTPLPDSTLASPRSLRLVRAEKCATSSQGAVLRLAGLYTLDRGAHNYWLEKGDGNIKGSRDGIINLLHYDDAAGACIAALKTGEEAKGKTFLISDGHPTTRGGICESALKSKRYGGLSMPSFGEEDQAEKGKIYDGSWTEELLNWKPRYESFDMFMENSQ